MSQEFGEKGTKISQMIRSAVGWYRRKPASVEPNEANQMVFSDGAYAMKLKEVRVLKALKSILSIASPYDTLVLMSGSITRNGADYTVAADTYGFINETWYEIKAGTVARTGTNYMTLKATSDSES